MLSEPVHHKLLPGPVRNDMVNLACDTCGWFKRVSVDELRENAPAIRDEHDHSKEAFSRRAWNRHEFALKTQDGHLYIWCTICSSGKKLPTDALVPLKDLERYKKQHWTHNIW